MPAQYEAIRDSLRKQHPGWSDKKVKKVAAIAYNKNRPKNAKPVTRWGD
jgi:hypothetical protein